MASLIKTWNKVWRKFAVTEILSIFATRNNKTPNKWAKQLALAKYTEFEGLNVLGLTIEHNGHISGDSVHGGYVKITLEDLASTDMRVNGVEADIITLEFRGGSERQTLIDALKAIVEELESNK